MSWLSVLANNNRNFVGNALKNVAPVVGALTGGIGGVALGGLGAALGQGIKKGSNIGDILKTGVENAMITQSAQKFGGEKLGDALKGALRGSPEIASLPIAPGAGVQPFGGLPPVGAPAPGIAGPLDIPVRGAPTGMFTNRTTLPTVTITAPADTAPALSTGKIALTLPENLRTPFVPPAATGAAVTPPSVPPTSFKARAAEALKKAALDPKVYGSILKSYSEIPASRASAAMMDAQKALLDQQLADERHAAGRRTASERALQEWMQRYSTRPDATAIANAGATAPITAAPMTIRAAPVGHRMPSQTRVNRLLKRYRVFPS